MNEVSDERLRLGDEDTETEELKLSHDENTESQSNDVPLPLIDESVRESADICPWTTFHGGMVFEDDESGDVGNSVYFVGLIDILQKYNKRKKLENWIKKMKYNKNSISSVPADLYAQRMCDFFEDKVV